MTKEKTATAAERPKVFCVNCQHAILTRAERKKPDKRTVALCLLTERQPTIDYVTGLKEITFTQKEVPQFGSFYYSREVPAKKVFGITIKKSYNEKTGDTRFAKPCHDCNLDGKCPTFEQYKEPVVQEDKKQ